jgi:hypothetical protein
MKIFISYRRADSKYVVDRIRDRLNEAFDEDAIFRDIESIPLGQNFSDVLNQSTSTCDVMLVVIGPQWASVTDSQGNKRLADPGDYTRLEVDTGLANKKILVIPVLVMGAQMPAAAEIPESLRDLLFRNAISVRNDPDFTPDMERLIQGIYEQFPDAAKARSAKRKTMGAPQLAAAVKDILAPNIKKAGSADGIAGQMSGALRKVWDAIAEGSPAAADAAGDLASNPEDADNETFFKKQLQKSFEKNRGFAEQLAELLEKAESEAPKAPAGDQITATATNNSVAVGKISVGGNVNGNFVIGNNNQVNGNK